MPVVIPGMVVVAAALLALMLLWGVKAFCQALAALVPKDLPFIGDRLHNVFAAFTKVAAASVQWIMADVITPVGNFILGPVVAFIGWLEGIKVLATQTANMVTWLVRSGIPQLAHSVRTFAVSLYHRATAYAASLYHAAIKHMVSLYHSATAYALSLYHSATAYTVKLYHSATAYSASLYHAATRYAASAAGAVKAYAINLVKAEVASIRKDMSRLEGLIKASAGASTSFVTSQIAKALGTAEQTAIADASKLIHAVDVDVAHAFAQTWIGISDEIDALEGVISTDLPDILAAIKAIPRAIPLDQAGAIAATGSIALPLIRYLRQCGVPNCRNLAKYGRDLSSLLHGAEAGLLLAVLAEMISDPEGSARAAQSVIVPLGRDAVNAGKTLLGMG